MLTPGLGCQQPFPLWAMPRLPSAQEVSFYVCTHEREQRTPTGGQAGARVCVWYAQWGRSAQAQHASEPAPAQQTPCAPFSSDRDPARDVLPTVAQSLSLKRFPYFPAMKTQFKAHLLPNTQGELPCT